MNDDFFDDDGNLKSAKCNNEVVTKSTSLEHVFSEDTFQDKAWSLMDEIVKNTIEQYDLEVNHNEIDLCTVEWKRLNGQARYNAMALKRHYGKKASTDYQKDNYVILVNRKILEQGNKEKFIDTILHELAHVEDYVRRGTSDHSYEWKRLAQKIGANPTRCGNKFETNARYKIRCTEGCFERGYHRMCKTLKNIDFYHCSNCGSKLERIK